MAVYLYANIEVTDPVAYEEYRRQVPPMIAACGGRYLVRGGATVAREGAPPDPRVVILEFPDMARLRAYYDSCEYRPLLASRKRASRSTLFAVEGV